MVARRAASTAAKTAGRKGVQTGQRRAGSRAKKGRIKRKDGLDDEWLCGHERVSIDTNNTHTCDEGLAETLGDSEGWLVGQSETEGFCDGCELGSLEIEGLSEGAELGWLEG